MSTKHEMAIARATAKLIEAQENEKAAQKKYDELVAKVGRMDNTFGCFNAWKALKKAKSAVKMRSTMLASAYQRRDEARDASAASVARMVARFMKPNNKS